MPRWSSCLFCKRVFVGSRRWIRKTKRKDDHDVKENVAGDEAPIEQPKVLRAAGQTESPPKSPLQSSMVKSKKARESVVEETRPQAKPTVDPLLDVESKHDFAPLSVLQSSADMTYFKKLYNVWALDFETDMAALGYRGPELVARLVSETLRMPADSKILDFCCVTGLLGAALKKRGYRNIEGIDPSENMIRIAEKKNCYMICRTVRPEETITGYYDLVAYCSALENSNVIVPCVGKLAQNLKPSSYLVVAQPLARHLIETAEAKKLIKRIEAAGNLQLAEVLTVREYMNTSMGFVAAFYPRH